MQVKSIFALFLSIWIAAIAVYTPVLHAVRFEKQQSAAQKQETSQASLLPADFIAHSSAHIDVSPAFDFFKIEFPQFSFKVITDFITTDVFSKVLICKILASNIQINAP